MKSYELWCQNESSTNTSFRDDFRRNRDNYDYDYTSHNQGCTVDMTNPNIASIMEKVNLYNKREFTAMGYGINESFRSYHKYNQDIMFTMAERESITEMFKAISEQIREEYEEEVECYRSIMVNEGFMDVLKKVSDKTRDIANSIKDEFKNGVRDVKAWATDKIAKAKQKYENIIKFINAIIKAGVKSVKNLIENVGKLITRLSDKLSGALAKLGAFSEPDKGEKEADVDVDPHYLDGVPAEQQGFFKHVVAYITTMTGTGKAAKLMNESFDFDCEGQTLVNEGLIDTIANNKFVQFILCYGKDKKVSWWKSLLISLVGSLIISVVLPLALTAFGTGAAAISTICGAVAMVWQCKGILKILLNRYVNKKPGEKFFDFSTTLSLVLCIVPMAIMKIPAVNQFLQDQFMALMRHFKVVIEKIGEAFKSFIDLIRGYDPNVIVTKSSVIEKIVAKIGSKTIKFTGDVATQRTAFHDYLADSGVDGDQISIFDKIGDVVDKCKSSLGIDKALDEYLKSLGDRCPGIMTFDTSKVGNNPAFERLLSKMLEDCPQLKGCVLTNVVGKGVFDATKGYAGGLPLIANATDAQKEFIQNYLAEKAKDSGVDLASGFLKSYGHGAMTSHISKITTSVVKVATDWMQNLHFTPVFVPWLDSKHWNDYRICFSSEQDGFKSYKVSEVKTMKLSEVEALDSENPAVKKLISNLKEVQKKHKELIDFAEEKVDDIKEELANLPAIYTEKGLIPAGGKNLPAPISRKDVVKAEKKRKKKDLEKYIEDQNKNYDKNGNLEDTDVIVVFVDAKDKDTNKVSKQPGIVIDMTTLMCADIAPFSSRRRKSPYFLKGLFGKLSFSPTEANDDETKEFIHEMLAKTFESACKACVKNGTGNFYIMQDEDTKKFEPMPDIANVPQFDIGNLTPAELCDVLNCKDKVNKKAYELMSGSYTTNLTFGEKGPKARKTHHTRETARYSMDMYGHFEKDNKGEFDYIDAKVIPEITDKDGEIYQQLYDNKDIRKILFKKGTKDIDVNLLTDKTLNIKKYLFRPETTFSSEDKDDLIKRIKKYKKEHEDTKWYERVSDWFDSDEDMYKALKEAIEIIWDELGLKKIKNYISIRKKSKATNEGFIMSFEEFSDTLL